MFLPDMFFSFTRVLQVFLYVVRMVFWTRIASFSVRERRAFFVRMCKSLSSRRVLKILGEARKEKRKEDNIY